MTRTRTATALTITAYPLGARATNCVTVEIRYSTQERGSGVVDHYSYTVEQINDPNHEKWDTAQPYNQGSDLSIGAVLYTKTYLFLLPEYLAESLFAIRQCCLLALETDEQQTLTITF